MTVTVPAARPSRLTLTKSRPQLATMIGRFAPGHKGHFAGFAEALEQADNLLIQPGSASVAPNPRNPLTFEQRSQIILDAMPASAAGRVHILPLNDHPYNEEKWLREVQDNVSQVAATLGIERTKKNIALAGHAKDGSSYYLNRFRQFSSIKLPGVGLPGTGEIISATTIRENLFQRNKAHLWLHGDGRKFMPDTTIDFLDRYVDTQAYEDMLREYEFVRKYRKDWAVAPYPPTFITVDAVIVHAGHVYMIERKGFPGRGQKALPGGYVDQGEQLVDAMIRELKQETRISTDHRILRAHIKSMREFSDPHRSARGRVITFAFLIHLPPEMEPPVVRAASDAKRAFALPLDELRETECFEDHFHIVQTMLDQIKA